MRRWMPPRPAFRKISVKVQRNDTLDQIFRRLQLSLTDLANIRALDGTRAALDRLRPGDLNSPCAAVAANWWASSGRCR